MNSLLTKFEEKLNKLSDRDLHSLFEDLYKLEGVGPTMEDFLQDNTFWMSCAQSENMYGDMSMYYKAS